MEEFVSDHVVRERHVNFFEDRKMFFLNLSLKICVKQCLRHTDISIADMQVAGMPDNGVLIFLAT